MDPFEEIYESMLGLLIPEAQAPVVANAFAPGELCDCAYTQMRRAYERLLSRLGAQDEDPDLDAMVEAMEIIQRELCRRMYGIGKG